MQLSTPVLQSEIMSLALMSLLLGIPLLLAVLYVVDRNQTRHALRRNYPLLARFRYLFEHLGEFFRQYFFAMDREEMPFNRAERSWVYRAAKKVDSTIAFGSTRDLKPAGTILFANCAFPKLQEEGLDTSAVTIGPFSREPYQATSVFHISAMSYGAISAPAVLALSQGAKSAGIWMNTGEGGLSAEHLEGGADLIFQIGTAKYGVRDASGGLCPDRLSQIAAHEQVKMFEIKLSQGAKPGKGGVLPGSKVNAEIARVRGIPLGEDSLSPNRHPEVSSSEDLLDLLETVRSVSGKPVGIKAVIGDHRWLQALCSTINARGIASAPDFITVDGAEGGTGAAPASLIDYMGLPLRESLPLVVDILKKHGLRERIRVIASGKLINPAQIAWALCVGADFATTARGFMFSLGCIQAMQCNKNTCPTGITTHDKRLQRGLVVANKSQRVANYAQSVRAEVAVIAHACGVQEPRQLQRQHCRIVQGDGSSLALDSIYPEIEST
ncbi:MAG: FMN-binding glutamate synthase family protein [Gammaproteobacteria bacterium TMED30]|jgi:glutamate synthase domain-containing protein 2|nr:MAG: FMN-binding glutamate synthase family protein [Gammaproteobacteria bacterium TMED30]